MGQITVEAHPPSSPPPASVAFTADRCDDLLKAPLTPDLQSQKFCQRNWGKRKSGICNIRYETGFSHSRQVFDRTFVCMGLV